MIQFTTTPIPAQGLRRWIQRLSLVILGILSAGHVVMAQVVIDQRPLIAAESVPGNLVLTPSVEWPTINSVANLGNYATNGNYAGYFDARKCYGYHFSTVEAERHFFPESWNRNGVCTSTNANLRWSGHFLNWALTQTIDPFRKALTGGHRVVDTPSQSWLEKARHDGQGGGGIFPTRVLGTDVLIRGASPFDGINNNPATLTSMRIRVHGLGNQFRLVLNNPNDNNLNLPPNDANVVAYNPAVHGRRNLANNVAYVFSARVRVCDATSSFADANGGVDFLEENCVRYPKDPTVAATGWKPEGLLQEFSERLRFSIFGYLNHSVTARDGAALRGRQKFVGPREFDPVQGWRTNANREWDPVTGVFIRNPDPNDASHTMATNVAHNPNIQDSGIINYINKFGQMTNSNHKSFDPVSEMYYAALRYIRNLPNVPQYTDLNGASAAANYNLADGFPVITNWTDPYQFWCQPTAILGIGDVNTHRDKNLPGTRVRSDEPTMPSLVQADTGINVWDSTHRVFQIEGIGNRTPAIFTGRENSAFIAGMAFIANTTDLRQDLQGKQRVTTHWVDVREDQVLAGRDSNQFWLAAKYGGFRVPEGFDPFTHSTPLPREWWSRNGEVLAGSGASAFIRADNFYVASDASRMIESLRSAFEQIESEQRRSGASLAANSTRLETGTTIYQSIYKSGTFSGDLLAFGLDPTTGAISQTLWSAVEQLPTSANRRIFANLGSSNTMEPFQWANSRRALFRSALNMPSGSDTELERLVNYLRGDRTFEEPNTSGTFRRRTDLLGSIINSQPVFVGAPMPGLYTGGNFNGASSYAAFVIAQAGRERVIYVNANDGMLHGFRAATRTQGNTVLPGGQEIFAFMPNAVFRSNLADYARPGFTHRYFLDGEITVADAFFAVPGTTGPWGQAQWRTVLIGSQGRGGRSVFALDITNPSDVRFLWERSEIDIPALGNVLGKPVVTQVADGDWRVLMGNGPNSAGNRAQLISISLANGNSTTVDTGVSGSTGLSAVFAWDSNRDGFSDRAYAGDLSGGVWRFSGLGTTSPTANLVFQARDAEGNTQPISASPLVARNPENGDTWIFVGTGRYLNTTDLSNTDPQTWYGLIDGPFIANRSSLNSIGLVGDFTVPGQEFARRVLSEGVEVNPPDRGWYFDLPVSGERMVLPNQLRGPVLIGTTRIPDVNDRCAPTGRGFIMAVDPFRGGRLPSSFFDVNLDGFINDGDTVMVNSMPVFVSGLGIANAPFNPIFTGNVMQVNREDGTINQIRTSGSVGQEIVRRTSWREIRR
jgi:type IV pilus assembly protein PilY1